MTNFTRPKSAICAANILDAWLENEPEKLNRRLVTGAAAELESVTDSDERERLELLDGIATEIRGFLATGQAQSAGVYLSLLHHLAEPAVILSDRHYDC